MKTPIDYGKIVYYPIYTRHGYDIACGVLLGEYIDDNGDKVFMATSGENLKTTTTIRHLKFGYKLNEKDAYKLLDIFKKSM